MNQIKNGFNYIVYGENSDPKTWKEENLTTHRKREMNRRKINIILQQNNS
jgi:hypothetical protein